MTVRIRVRPMLLALPLILTGCSSLSNMSWPDISWSGMNPLNWFGSSLTVSDKGVGGITSSTPLTETAVKDALDGDYTLRSGMSMSDGKMLSFFQAMDGKDVKMSISGEPKGNVQRVDVVDPKVESEWGSKSAHLSARFTARPSMSASKAKGMMPKTSSVKRRKVLT